MIEDIYAPYNKFIYATERIIKKRKSYRPMFVRQLDWVKESKLFVVEEEISWMFNTTKPSVKNKILKLPFDNIFLNDSFKYLNIKIHGINIKSFEGGLDSASPEQKEKRVRDFFKEEKINASEKEIKEAIEEELEDIGNIKISALLEDEDGKGLFEMFSIRLDNFEVSRTSKIMQKENKTINYRKKIKDYVVNAILFLNEPRVITYDINVNNKRRERSGKIPIPTLLMTRIERDLKQYISIGYKNSPTCPLGYSYQVMGHWRTLKHPKYKENIGRKIWIPPHWKGEGIKVNQQWVLGK